MTAKRAGLATILARMLFGLYGWLVFFFCALFALLAVLFVPGEERRHRLAAAATRAIFVLAGVRPEMMLILSDINMPGMNGLELLKEVKQMWPSLPIAMITAYGDDQSRRTALEAGATDFLTKPLDFDELKSKISDMIAQRSS